MGEDIGIDRYLKSNTSKRRQHSLFKQGIMWFDLLHTMKPAQLKALMQRFQDLLYEHDMFTQLFGVI